MIAAVLALTVEDEQALRLPVIAGLAAMVATAYVLAWWRARRHQLPPGNPYHRCPADPAPHFRILPRPYDQARHPEDQP